MYEEYYSETRFKESTNDASLQCVLKRIQLLGHLGVATDRIRVTSNVRLHWLKVNSRDIRVPSFPTVSGFCGLEENSMAEKKKRS